MEDLVIGLIGLTIAVLIDGAVWGLAIYLWLRRRIFLARAVRVEGRCVGVRVTKHGEQGVGHDVYHPIVRFEDEQGRSHKVGCTKGNPMWDDMVGTPLDVLMLPGKPETALVELDKHNAPTAIALVAVGFAVPVLMFGAVVVASLRG